MDLMAVGRIWWAGNNSSLIATWFQHPSIKSYHGVSLTRSIIPSNRTCSSAFIPDEYCPCFDEHPLNASSELAHTLAQHVVGEVNERLRNVSHLCYLPLKFNTVIDVQQLQASNGTLRETERQLGSLRNTGQMAMYRVSLSVQPPSNAVFQAVVRIGADNVSMILGDIDRNNRYGRTSTCVGRELRKLCFCKMCETKSCD